MFAMELMNPSIIFRTGVCIAQGARLHIPTPHLIDFANTLSPKIDVILYFSCRHRRAPLCRPLHHYTALRSPFRWLLGGRGCHHVHQVFRGMYRRLICRACLRNGSKKGCAPTEQSICFRQEIDKGTLINHWQTQKAPEMAIKYWELKVLGMHAIVLKLWSIILWLLFKTVHTAPLTGSLYPTELFSHHFFLIVFITYASSNSWQN